MQQAHPRFHPRLVLAAAVMPLLLAAGCGRQGAQGPGAPPNVVLISIDTLRADKLGAYGHPAPTSPVLDRRLAGEGATFTNCISQSPKTTPSHMTMLTSLYPSVHGVDMWQDNQRGLALRPEIDTLAEVLKRVGYATVAFTGNGHVHASRGFDQGFDIYQHGRPLEKTVEWLRAHGREKPFFLFYHTYVVHDPYVHPLKLVRQFDPGYQGPFLQVLQGLSEKKSNWGDRSRIFWEGVDKDDAATVDFVRHLYEAGIRRMDDVHLTQILDTLDALKLAQDTLVVFTSDHGEAFLEHGHFLHEDLHVETLHVPFVVRFPGRVTAGTRVDAPVRLLDVMPTILDLAGVPTQTAAQGRSLVPLLRGEKLEPLPVISEWNEIPNRPPLVAVRDGGYAYIVDGDEELLYDVGRDPGEQRSMAHEASRVVADRRVIKEAWDAQCRTRIAALGPRPLGDAPDEETQKQLRALGYVK